MKNEMRSEFDFGTDLRFRAGSWLCFFLFFTAFFLSRKRCRVRASDENDKKPDKISMAMMLCIWIWGPEYRLDNRHS